jgi:hypothetical protein
MTRPAISSGDCGSDDAIADNAVEAEALPPPPILNGDPKTDEASDNDDDEEDKDEEEEGW